MRSIYIKTMKFQIIILIIIILLLHNSISQIQFLKTNQIIANKPEEVNLIIVLEGDILSRFNKAFKLAEKGYSNTIYSPGIVYKENSEFVQLKLIQDEQILFFEGPGASSTLEEAILTKSFIENYSKNIQKVILVTSDYHSKRADYVFSYILNDIEIISVPTLTDFSNDLKNGKPQDFLLYKQERKKTIFYFLLINSKLLQLPVFQNFIVDFLGNK